MPSKKAAPIPPGVKEAATRACAARKKGARGTKEMLVKEFGLTDSQAKDFLRRDRNGKEIDDVRGAISEGCFALAGQGMAHLSKAFADEKRMKKAPVVHIAKSIETLVNTGVTALEGHRPMVTLNLGNAIERDAKIAQRQQRLNEMKKAQDATTV